MRKILVVEKTDGIYTAKMINELAELQMFSIEKDISNAINDSYDNYKLN